MVFYDKNGNTYDFNISKDDYFDRGRNAKIYRISDNECLKVMNRDPDNYLREDIYDVINSLFLPTFVRINTPFYVNEKIKAYTMEYLKKSNISILDMPIEYTLDNLNNMYKDLSVLAKYWIDAFDLCRSNVIIGDNGMTIIDYDAYKRCESESEALFYSVWNLMYTFRKIFERALEEKGINIDKAMIDGVNIAKYLSSYLFKYSYDNYMEEPSKVLKRKLVDVKTPMDLFRNIKNN